MERLFRYIETSAGRNKVIRVLEIVALTSGAIVTVVLLTAIYFRDYA